MYGRIERGGLIGTAGRRPEDGRTPSAAWMRPVYRRNPPRRRPPLKSASGLTNWLLS